MIAGRRTLFLAPCQNDSVHGGIQRSASSIVPLLGPSDALICYGPACAAPHPQQCSRCHCAHSKMTAAMAAVRYAVARAAVLSWHIGLLKLVPLFRRRTQVSLYLHGIECWRPADALTARLLNGVDRFLTNSQFTWDQFTRSNPRFSAARHCVVPLGIESPAGPAESPSGPPAALITGRMSREEDYKGHRELIAAWPLLLRSLPDAQLWVAGSGDLEPDLRDLAGRLGVGHAVRFFGRVTEEEKARLLRECTCFVMPSRGEGFGLAYLEAMRQGRPCLCGTADGAREVVNPPEAGLAADPRDERALVDALEQLLRRDGRWQAWSGQARRRYEESFTEVAFQRRLLAAIGPEDGA